MEGGGGLRVTFLPHALERMAEQGISEDRARDTLEAPDAEYPAERGRTMAERTLEGERLAVKVVYNLGLQDERVVVSVFRGRPKFPEAAGGGSR